MPPDPRELWDAFEKLFRSQREGLISRLVAESKDYAEEKVASFYRSGKNLDHGGITKSTWFSKSYKLGGRLSTRCILGTVYDGYIGKKLITTNTALTKSQSIVLFHVLAFGVLFFPAKKILYQLLRIAMQDCMIPELYWVSNTHFFARGARTILRLKLMRIWGFCSYYKGESPVALGKGYRVFAV